MWFNFEGVYLLNSFINNYSDTECSKYTTAWVQKLGISLVVPAKSKYFLWRTVINSLSVIGRYRGHGSVMSNLFCHRRRLVGGYQRNMLIKRNAHHQQGTLLKTRNGLQQPWEHANSNIPEGRQTWLCTFSGTPQPQAQFLEAPMYMDGFRIYQPPLQMFF